MKNILVLGAGLVARPLVRYLLDTPGVHLKIASRTLSKAEKLIANHSKGTCQQLNVKEQDKLKAAVSEADIVISLLPWLHHLKVANFCLELGKSLVTTSYIKPEMQALDQQVKDKGLLFLNEIGVDPGIDHMAAMKIINQVKAEGGEVVSFKSYCGGLPALESNNNPFGYKFSWSPAGVMLAAKNNGKYLINEKVVDVPGEKLFEHYHLIDIPGAGTFEAYVNRDALPYRNWYDIPNIKTIYRGTLRNISHCDSWNLFKKLGLLDEDKKFNFDKVTPKQVIMNLIGSNGNDLEKDVAKFLNIADYTIHIKKMRWLGLFDEQKIPINESSVFDMFAYLLETKLVYDKNDLDLLIQHHEFIAEYPDGKKKQVTSTMVDKGIIGGDTSMARTVSLPAAIATRLIIEGKIKLKGVHIPVMPEIYKPVLQELEKMNIKLDEVETDLN